MKEQFPNVTVYATFGNHDYYPRDQYPPHNNEIYNDTYTLWKSWINDLSQDQYFLKGNGAGQIVVINFQGCIIRFCSKLFISFNSYRELTMLIMFQV